MIGSVCDSCRATNQAGAKFCAKCGAPVLQAQQSCRSCGKVPEPGARFCWSCGKPLGPEQPTSPAPGEPAKSAQPEPDLRRIEPAAVLATASADSAWAKMPSPTSMAEQRAAGPVADEPQQQIETLNRQTSDSPVLAAPGPPSATLGTSIGIPPLPPMTTRSPAPEESETPFWRRRDMVISAIILLVSLVLATGIIVFASTR